MHLIFERGDHDSPVGHALIYFRDDAGVVLATYVSIPPISFDLSEFVPPMFKNMLEGINIGKQAMVAAIPPIPQEVSGVEYLQALAERRNDDLVYAGGTMRTDPMRMGSDASQAAQAYEELYSASPVPDDEVQVERVSTPDLDPELARYAAMSEREQLDALTTLTGRLRDSLQTGTPDAGTLGEMRQLAALLPAKYRSASLVDAAMVPGERGQKLAALHLERCYKLYHEDYLDLERIDREIEAIAD